MTLTEIKQRLQTANLYRLSKITGITWQTLYRFKTGKTETLQKATKEKIETYFQEQGQCVNPYQK